MWGSLTGFYSRVGDPPHCKLRVPLPPPQREAPSSLILILNTDKVGKKPEYCVTQRDSTHASPLSVMGTIYQTQSQGYENTAYLSSPDIRVRKPN